MGVALFQILQQHARLVDRQIAIHQGRQAAVGIDGGKGRRALTRCDIDDLHGNTLLGQRQAHKPG